MKRLSAILLCLMLGLSLTLAGLAEDSDQSTFTWQIELRESAIAEMLHTDEGVQQYSGEVLNVPHDNAPSEGNVFLILTLTVKKAAVGAGGFDWAKLCVKDADGNAYARMEDDSFLSVHTYRRMQGTKLAIGENKGSICFEIPEAAAQGALWLEYDAGDEGVNRLSIQ